MLNQILGSSFDVARQALGGLSRRQSAIAANVANIDTPGYRRREVTFEDALRVQIAERPAGLRVTDPRHISRTVGGDIGAGAGAYGRPVVSERNDANDVSIDEEMLLLVDTQLRFQALAQTTGKRLTTLRTVIRGG
ncbi:MAG: flagellar basal body rod protein FlgB [Dehalococcoidia bacterium]|nr:flagellar basal body rod protein FlgB [Dehalococcoidia bacterium]